VAAVGIAVTAVDLLVHPQPIDDVGVGLAVAVIASLTNLVVGVLLVRAGRKARSIVLEADGKHLLTDVWTSVGVIVGVAGVAVHRLGPSGRADRARRRRRPDRNATVSTHLEPAEDPRSFDDATLDRTKLLSD
jgi:hypothetical protein